MKEYDLFVIGAGSGGVRAARMAAGHGAKVAIAEDKYLGGTCVNVGCVPKKLYTYAAHYRYDFEDSRQYGWSPGEPAFDWPVLRDNKKKEISRLNGIYESILKNAKVEIVQDKAVIEDAHTVRVAGETCRAQYILIATGGWPYVPAFPGNELVVTSNEIFDLETFPQRLLIVGGGYIAVEFAGIFAGLGAETSLALRRGVPLRGFDEDIRRVFTRELSRHVTVKAGCQVEEIARSRDGELEVRFDDGSEGGVDCVLYATGRKPRIEGLGLENVNVRTGDKGFIQVDEHYRTGEPSIYALGDVIGRVQLTPVALAEGMYVADHLFGAGRRTMDYRNIPSAVFSHPNIGSVGMTEQEALDAGEEIDVFESDFRHLKHTISGREEKTYMKVIVRRDEGSVLGIHMIGDEAGEIIQGFAAAMNCGLTKKQLDSTIGIHPTAAEEFVTMRTPRQ